MKKSKRSVGYVIYFIGITGVFLYYLFPSDAVIGYLQVKAENLNPSLSIAIDRVTPWPPLGLRFTNARVLYDAKNALNAEVKLEAVRVGDHENLGGLIGRSVQGLLSGTISYSGRRERVLNGSGQANFRLTDGRIELLSPLLTLEAIDYSEVTINMVLNRKRVNLTRLELEGPMLRGTVTGIIRLKEELEKSNIDLKGTIEPFAPLFKEAEGAQSVLKFFKGKLRKGALPFRIRGTIAHPRITFI